MNGKNNPDRLRAAVRRAVARSRADAEKRSEPPEPIIPAQPQEPEVLSEAPGQSDPPPPPVSDAVPAEPEPEPDELSDIVPSEHIADSAETVATKDSRSAIEWLLRK